MFARNALKPRQISEVLEGILCHHGFPPDLQESAVKQAKTLFRVWTGE